MFELAKRSDAQREDSRSLLGRKDVSVTIVVGEPSGLTEELARSQYESAAVCDNFERARYKHERVTSGAAAPQNLVACCTCDQAAVHAASLDIVLVETRQERWLTR